MRRLVIAGDRTVDRFFYAQPAGDTGENWQLVPSNWDFYLPGGVLLLEQLIRGSLEMREELKKLRPEISVTPPPERRPQGHSTFFVDIRFRECLLTFGFASVC